MLSGLGNPKQLVKSLRYFRYKQKEKKKSKQSRCGYITNCVLFATYTSEEFGCGCQDSPKRCLVPGSV